jgi:hypothetical protein
MKVWETYSTPEISSTLENKYYWNVCKATIIIIIGKTALFEPYRSLEDSARPVYSNEVILFSLFWIS